MPHPMLTFFACSLPAQHATPAFMFRIPLVQYPALLPRNSKFSQVIWPFRSTVYMQPLPTKRWDKYVFGHPGTSPSSYICRPWLSSLRTPNKTLSITARLPSLCSIFTAYLNVLEIIIPKVQPHAGQYQRKPYRRFYICISNVIIANIRFDQQLHINLFVLPIAYRQISLSYSIIVVELHESYFLLHYYIYTIGFHSDT